MRVELPEAADRELQAQRFTAQLLAGPPAASAVEVADRLLAVQGQDPRGARLAIRARSSGLTAADVDRACTRERSLLVTWLNRGTLHLVRSEDYWWVHSLTARPQFQVGCRRILAGLGLSDSAADKGVRVAEQALLAHGALTGPQLADRLATAGLPSRGGVALNVLTLASLRGMIVRGPVIGAQHAYVHVRDWLGERPPAPDPDIALAELARRYLIGHGPASEADLAKWAGVPVGQARRGLSAIAGQLRDRPDDLAELASGPGRQHHGLPSPRLLGAYDPVLLGWASRAAVLGEHQHIVTVNGLFRPFALVEGRAIGVWAWTRGQVVLDRFAELPAPVESALAAEARDVQRFLAAEPGSADNLQATGDPDATA